MEPLLLGFAMIVVWWIAWFGSRYWSIRKRGEAIEDDREDYQRSRIEDLEIMLDNIRQELYFKRDDLEQANEEKIGLENDLALKVVEIHELESEVKKQKGRAASAHTTRGQLLEKWTPFVSAEGIEDHWKPEDWTFLGQPIDYVVFDWRKDKELNLKEGKVILLDVKSGKASLSTKQRRIRDLIQKGKVEWRELRLD
jgi:predicted Holliday junction resolvase-like endonuclease|tara:strand:+ start:10 stop:600 length:591 start_codon:yes stop_codon:yes gene_type:complete